MSDAVVLELACWQQILDTLGGGAVPLQTLCSVTEPEQRAMLWLQAADERMHLVTMLHAWGAGRGNASSKSAATNSAAAAESDSAVQELLAWNDLVSRAATNAASAGTSTAEKEHALHAAAVTVSQSDVRRIEAQRASAQADLRATMASVAELNQHREQLETDIARLRADVAAGEADMHALRIEKANDRQQLEQQLRDLRFHVTRERELLESLRLGTNAAVEHPRSVAAPYAAGVGLHAAAAAGPLSPGSLVPSASAPTAKASLASGLAALHNVRNQLREIREANSAGSPNDDDASPPRSAAAPATPPSSANRAPTVAGGTTGNPWKDRLSKLQSDLKFLKAELGTE